MTVPVTTFNLASGQNFNFSLLFYGSFRGSNSVSYGLCERQDDNSQDYSQQPDIFSFLCKNTKWYLYEKGRGNTADNSTKSI